MIDLVLVDDHTVFRQSLAFMLDLQADLAVTGQAGSLEEARQVVATTPVDVLLLDLDLAGETGLDLIAAMRLHRPEAVTVVLTGNLGDRPRAMAIAAGAVGVVHKTSSIEQIAEVIRRADRGDPLISPREAVDLMAEGEALNHDAAEGRRLLDSLSPREAHVLRALAAGLDNQGIADRLFVGPETIRTHLARIHRKLGVGSRLQAVIFALRHGFLTDDDLA
jgi:DNA-binding NarL/FixJ family response regulator